MRALGVCQREECIFGAVRQGGKHANPIIPEKKAAFGLNRGGERAALFLEGGGRVEEGDEK